MMPRTPNTGQAVEYLRRSVERNKQQADKDRGALQRAANAENAARDGVTIARTYDADWGISGGRGARAKRAAMAEMIDAIRAGEVSTIYVYTADRAARDVEYAMTLWNACNDAGTIIAAGPMRLNPREEGWLGVWLSLIGPAQIELEKITQKNQDSQDFGRKHAATCPLPGRPHRGRCHLIGCTDASHCPLSHKRGRVPYGQDPSHPEEAAALARLLELWSEHPTYLAVAKAANAEHLPTRFAGADWHAGSVSRILRAAGVANSAKARRGARAKATRVYAGLLRCGGTTGSGARCGAILTSQPRPDGRSVNYLCRAAHNDGSHSRPYVVSERYIEAAARIEAAHFQPIDPKTGRRMTEGTEADNAAALLALEAEKASILYQHTKHYISDGELDATLAPILARMAALARGSIEAIPQAIDFDLPPADLNAALRAIWTRVDLDANQRPAAFTWRFPEWRR